MAVLVRSAARQVPLLRRALTAASVPVTVAGDELPLTDEPGTRPLLMLLRCALRPAELDEQTAAELLCGPLGGTDALGLRRLRRVPPAAGRRRPGRAGPGAAATCSPPPCSTRGTWPCVPDRVAEPARRVARLLAVARTAIKAGRQRRGRAVGHLGRLRPGAAQWQQVSAAGGPAGAAADRDLDAVLALFDQAAHFADTMPPGAPALFADSLTGQEIAGDTLAERAVRDDCVRILTAHRSKGLEWDVVVVAGVQEETWPDLRLRGSLLGVGRAGRGGAPWPLRGGPAGPGPGSGPGADVDAAHAGRQAAGRGTPAVLRGGHPGPAAARRHRGGRRGHRPAAVPVPDRAGRRRRPDRAGRRRPRGAPLAVHARAGRRPAPGRRRHRAARWPSGRPRRPSWPGWPPPGSAPPTRASGTR